MIILSVHKNTIFIYILHIINIFLYFYIICDIYIVLSQGIASDMTKLFGMNIKDYITTE